MHVVINMLSSMETIRGGTTGSDVYSNFALMHVVACSEIYAGVKVGGSLLSVHLFLMCL